MASERLALRDAARESICEGNGPDESEVRILEVQRRQGQHVAKYVIEGMPHVRYQRVEVEGRV